jgi:hypothetical protein
MEGRDKTQIIVSKLQKSTTPSKSARLIIDEACKEENSMFSLKLVSPVDYFIVIQTNKTGPMGCSTSPMLCGISLNISAG